MEDLIGSRPQAMTCGLQGLQVSLLVLALTLLVVDGLAPTQRNWRPGIRTLFLGRITSRKVERYDFESFGRYYLKSGHRPAVESRLLSRTYLSASGGGKPTQEKSTRAKIHPAPSPDEVMACLEAFYAHYLHLRVPSDFVVPSNESSDSFPWPSSVQGAPLGRMVMYMRRYHRADASSSSLPTSSSPSSLSSSTNPKNEREREKYQWSASWRPVVHALKSNEHHNLRLQQLGFMWDVRQHRNNRLSTGMEWFRATFGHSDVPTNFVLPDAASNSTSAQTARDDYHYAYDSNSQITNASLAVSARESKGKGQGQGQNSKKSDSMTVRWIPPPLGLECYQLGRAIARLKRKQQLTTNSSRVAKAAAGRMRGASGGLRDREGATTTTITTYVEVLSQLDLHPLPRRRCQIQLTVAALQAHFEVFGDFLVPRYFVVPYEDPWPREAWGMQLGNRARNIRYYGAYSDAESRLILREIGFFSSSSSSSSPSTAPR